MAQGSNMFVKARGLNGVCIEWSPVHTGGGGGGGGGGGEEGPETG